MAGDTHWHPLTLALLSYLQGLCVQLKSSTTIKNENDCFSAICLLENEILSQCFSLVPPCNEGAISGEYINWIYLLCLEGMVMKDTWPIRRYSHSISRVLHLSWAEKENNTLLICKVQTSFAKCIRWWVGAHPGFHHIKQSERNSCLKCKIYIISYWLWVLKMKL